MASTLIASLDELSAAGLLAAARERRRVADRAEADLLLVAAAWADRHPPESIADAAVFAVAGSDHVEPVAGPGCPAVAEFCVAELGAVLGMSTMAAKRLVGQALELRHRLPRLWGRVQAGEVAPWRARRVAETTIHACPELSQDAVGWVDAQVAPFAERVGVAQLDRTVAEAVERFGPAVLPEDPEDLDPPRADTRGVRIEPEQVSWHGTVNVTAELDLVDALDLDHAVATGAAELAAFGSVKGLGARRAAALGHLARHQLALDLAGAGRIGVPEAPEPGAASGRSLPAARELVLHLHLAASLTGNPGSVTRSGGLLLDGLGRLEEGQRLVLLDQVKAWCAGTHTKVTIKPMIDLNVGLSHPGYQPTVAQRECVALRDRTCLFPWCGRPARRCDVDHVQPFDHEAATEGRSQPGPTHTDNLVALCRRHHRLKTHSHWRVQARGPGQLVWTSPHGHRFCCDATGTTRIDGEPGNPDSRAGPPRP